MAIVKEIKGNLLDTDIDFIAHGVNCQGKMGSGVAKAISDLYPEVKAGYLNFFQTKLPLTLEGGKDFLGTVQTVITSDKKRVFNCFTQEYYGYDGQLYVSYKAIREVFEILAEHYSVIAIPRIGCGLAGGNWDIVKEIINEVTGDRLDVHVYYL